MGSQCNLTFEQHDSIKIYTCFCIDYHIYMCTLSFQALDGTVMKKVVFSGMKYETVFTICLQDNLLKGKQNKTKFIVPENKHYEKQLFCSLKKIRNKSA